MTNFLSWWYLSSVGIHSTRIFPAKSSTKKPEITKIRNATFYLVFFFNGFHFHPKYTKKFFSVSRFLIIKKQIEIFHLYKHLNLRFNWKLLILPDFFYFRKFEFSQKVFPSWIVSLNYFEPSGYFFIHIHSKYVWIYFVALYNFISSFLKNYWRHFWGDFIW